MAKYNNKLQALERLRKEALADLQEIEQDHGITPETRDETIKPTPLRKNEVATRQSKGTALAVHVPAKEQLLTMATRINTYNLLKDKADQTIAEEEKRIRDEQLAVNRIYTKQRTLLLQQEFKEKSE